jgi:hypothetical protein
MTIKMIMKNELFSKREGVVMNYFHKYNDFIITNLLTVVQSLEKFQELYGIKKFTSKSKWPRGLRHELSSPARTMGSGVRIPLKAWMFVCVYSVCVQVEALRRSDPPFKESYRLS